MTTRKEMSKINRLVEIIQREKKINKVQLVMASGISISYFEKLRPFLLEIYQQQIRFNKEEGYFESIKNVKVANK